MARRSDHTREEIKEMAVKSAVKLAIEGGIKDVTTRKIADAIGYTSGTLYNVFKDHDDLILHVNAYTLDLMYQGLKESLTNTPKDKLIETLASGYLNFSKEHPNLWSILFEYRTLDETILPDWYKKKITTLFMMVEDALLPLTNNSRKDAVHAAKVLWAGLHGICSLSASGKLDIVDSEPAEALIDSFLTVFTRGLGSNG